MHFAVPDRESAIASRLRAGHPASLPPPTRYRTVPVDGLDIFYREAGNDDAPALLLLHGFPSSSRMFEPLLARLAARYRLIAPDYPGFGHSSAPPAAEFAYTFDHLAAIVDRFTEAIGVPRYAMYLHDYGGPVGMRLALAHPERVAALIVQNAVVHEEGLGAVWAARRAYWSDRAAHEAAIREAMLSESAGRARHIGLSPHAERFDPDRWCDEIAFLLQPGQQRIQSDLAYDYRNNVAAYPRWQAWLREHAPPTQVIWGRHDPIFTVAGAYAFRREIPDAEIIELDDAGHFALFDAPEEIARHVDAFLSGLTSARAQA